MIHWLLILSAINPVASVDPSLQTIILSAIFSNLTIIFAKLLSSLNAGNPITNFKSIH